MLRHASPFRGKREILTVEALPENVRSRYTGFALQVALQGLQANQKVCKIGGK